MKRILLQFLILPSIVFAQYTEIPDQNFEKVLIELGYDSKIDGRVETNKISHVESLHLNVYVSEITDLTGLQGFTSLIELHVLGDHDMGSNLTVLDVTKNIALKEFYYDYHYDGLIESLDLTMNVDLILLSCDFSSLKNLDISNNINLQDLYIPGNNLTTLDVS